VPRILIVHTGGTLGMSAAAGGTTLAPETYVRDLSAELPSLKRVADIETRILFNLDSGDMQPSHWVALAREVHGALAGDAFDGVVVVHGTDTMAYTASALALMLGPLPRAVVLTGAQRPLAEVRTDARENLIDAALVATLDVPEVSIAFASRALRGVRSTKRDAWALDAFDAPNCPPLVKMGVGVEIASHVRARSELAPFDGRIETRVIAVRVFPGIDPSLVAGALRVGVRGLVLEAYGTGNLPRLEGTLIPVLEEARDRGVAVIVVSQCLRGFVELARYVGGASAEAAGAISGGDMTVEAAIAKMMIALARYDDPKERRAYLERDVIGERSPNDADYRTRTRAETR
jgi:L-asparaginase